MLETCSKLARDSLETFYRLVKDLLCLVRNLLETSYKGLPFAFYTLQGPFKNYQMILSSCAAIPITRKQADRGFVDSSKNGGHTPTPPANSSEYKVRHGHTKNGIQVITEYAFIFRCTAS